MVTLTPVENDPFAASGPQDDLTARPIRIAIAPGARQPKLTPVDYDPFAKIGTTEDVAKSAGAGVVKGAIGLAGLPGDLAEYGARGIDAATRFVGGKLGVSVEPRAAREPTYGQANIRKAVESVTGPLYNPKTTAGEYAQTIGEFVPGALMGPGGVVSRAASVVVPAVLSETGGQLTKGTQYEGAARFAGALAGGVGVGLASRPGTASRAIREALPEGVTPQMVDDAARLMDDAAQQGIRLAWPEALSQVAGRPVLTNTMRHLEAAPQTEARMAEFFGGRAGQVGNAARQQFDNITPPNMAPSTIGPAVGTAAEDTVTAVRGAINSSSEPLYRAAAAEIMDPATMARIRAAPGWQEARDAVRNNPQLARYVQGQPDESVGFLNEVQKYLGQQADNAAAPVAQQRNMQVSAGYGLDRELVRDSATRQSPALAQAIGEQATNRARYLDPLLQGPLGKIASKDTTTKAAIDALFPVNPLANSADEIATTVGALATRNPRAARDLVRAHVEGTFNESAQALQSGANQMGGAKFRSVLVGNPQQSANLEAAVRALPNGDQVWPGFNRFLEILEATGTRPNVGSRTAYNAELLKGQGMSGVAGEAAKAGANPLKGLQFIADKYERYRLGQNLNELANILTDPGSVNRLRAIARMPANGSQTINTAARLLTQAAAAR